MAICWRERVLACDLRLGCGDGDSRDGGRRVVIGERGIEGGPEEPLDGPSNGPLRWPIISVSNGGDWRSIAMTGAFPRCLPLLMVLVALGGCGVATEEAEVGADGAEAGRSAEGVYFVGFDGSPPLVGALRSGTIQGLVLQNPERMGYLGVKTLIDHLEGREVEAVIATGEVLATPENMERAGGRGAAGPAEGRARGRCEPVGGEVEEVASDGDPEGDDARVLADDPRRGEAGGRRGRRRVALEGAAEGGRPAAADRAGAERRSRWASTGSSSPRSTRRPWSGRSSRRSPGGSRWSSSIRP